MKQRFELDQIYKRSLKSCLFPFFSFDTMDLWSRYVVCGKFLFLTFLVSTVLGYPQGPPGRVCADMTPLHGVLASNDPFEYTISTSSRTYCKTTRITVSITSNAGVPFRGFFCQARPNANKYETIGKIEAIAGEKSTKNDCGDKIAALSHADGNAVSSVFFKWIPDETKTNNFYIVCTIVQERIRYWVRQVSQVISFVDLNNCPVTELPKECANDQICDAAIKYSVCDRNADADGNCICPSDRKFADPANPACSQKGLGDSCTSQDDCKFVTSSTCNADRKCACADGYVAKSNACVIEQVSDVVCSSTNDCSRFQYSRCNPLTSRCYCTQEVTEVNGRCQLKGLGDSCTQDTDCTAGVADSSCDQTSKKCQCEDTYLEQNGQCVRDPTVCTSDTCRNIPNSYCSAGVCLCTSAYKKESGQCVPKDTQTNGKSCFRVGGNNYKRMFYNKNGFEDDNNDTTICTADTCRNVPNSECDTGSCVCVSGYKKENGLCVPKVLGDPCNSSSECTSVEEAVCDLGGTRKCICSALYEQEGIECTLKDPGDPCNTDTCKDIPNSFCNPGSTVCICLSAYKTQDNKCVPKVLGDGCGITDDCKAVTNSICSPTTATCTCTSSYKPKDGQNNLCIWKGLGDSCNANDDCRGVPSSFCNNRRCDCISSYKQTENGQCTMKGLSDTCARDTDCNTLQNLGLVCDSATKRCACAGAYKQSADTCVLKGLSDVCSTNDNCKGVPNALCNPSTGRCACPVSFKEINGQCLSRELGETCLTNEYCRGIPMSICGVSDKKCTCTEGYIERNKRCELEVYDIVCANNADCAVIPLAICDTENTKKCVCPVGYTREKGSCQPNEIGGDCIIDEDCKIVPVAVCNASKKCACPAWQKPRTTTECEVKGISDSCKYNDDCRGTPNALCDRTNTRECRCMTAYKQMSNSTHVYCAIRGIGDVCGNSEECAGIKGANCQINKCACPPGMKNMNNECVLKVLQKYCDAPEECKGVSYATCANNKCTCSYGYDDVIDQDRCRSNGRLTAGALPRTVLSGALLLICLIVQCLLSK